MRAGWRAVLGGGLASVAALAILDAASGGAAVPAFPAWRVSELPAQLGGLLEWRPGTEGIEWAELQLRGEGEAWRTRVIVARVDPRRVALSLSPAFTDGRRWTIAEVDSPVAVAVNAGQFRGSLPWGWVVAGGRELLAPEYAPLAGAVVVDRTGALRIVPPGEVAAEQRRGRAWEAFQSYPMLLEDGAPPVALVRPGLGIAVDHRDARLALGTLADGRVVLALTRFDALGPALGRIPFGFTSVEMASLMRALGSRQAILLDGGISGQLMVREAGGGAQSWPGVRSVPLGLVGRRR